MKIKYKFENIGMILYINEIYYIYLIKLYNILNAINNIYIKEINFNKISASVGAVIGCIDDNDIEDLLIKCDIALYKAISMGKNKSVLYTLKLDKERKLTLEIQRDIVQVIKNDQIAMCYYFYCKELEILYVLINNNCYEKLRIL